MMSIRNHVEALQLSNGMAQRTACPACGRDNTFSVTNNNGKILYYCFSAHCGVKGAFNMGLSIQDIKDIRQDVNIHLGTVLAWDWNKFRRERLYSIDEDLIEEWQNEDDYVVSDLYDEYDRV